LYLKQVAFEWTEKIKELTTENQFHI
jgi:hypothetical protein